MVDRIGDAPEHEADAHAGAEEHGKPAPRGNLRPGLGATQTDVAEAAQQQVVDDTQVDVDGGDEEPAGAGGYRALHRIEDCLQLRQAEETEGNEEGDESGRGPEYGWVNLQSHSPTRCTGFQPSPAADTHPRHHSIDPWR